MEMKQLVTYNSLKNDIQTEHLIQARKLNLVLILKKEKMTENSKCGLCGDGDETISHQLVTEKKKKNLLIVDFVVQSERERMQYA